MATQAVDLGRFAPEQGATSPWAAASAALGTGAAAIAAIALVLDASGAATLRSRAWSLPLGCAAVVAAIAGLYHVSAYGRRGKVLASWGAVLGVSGALVAFVHDLVHTGTLELAEFGIAYFDREIISAIWPDIRRAAVNTIKYAAIAEGFGIALGLVVATFAVSKRRWLRFPATIYVDVIRGLPLLMLLLLVYFGPSFLGIRPTFTLGILALIINSSAYVAEIFRAGIQAVEKGQMDGARSLGMPYATAMIHVVIPQAVRKVIPPLTNEFIALVKDTSLLLIIGMTVSQRELLTAARQLSSSSFSATPYMIASIAYLVITLPLTRLVAVLERRLLAGDRLLPIRLRARRREPGLAV